MVLCGWGKGKFRQGNPQSELEPTEIRFDAEPDGLVMVDSQPCETLSEVLQKMKATKPDAKVCYHNAEQEPDGSWKFSQEG